MKSVSSAFIDELNKVSSVPERFFFLGGSDYSDRVTRWPRIGFKIDELKSANPSIQCANDDGHFNYFFNDVFNLAQAGGQKVCTFGFGYPTTSSDLVTNGDFETGDLTGWSAFADGLTTVTSNSPYVGNYNMRTAVESAGGNASNLIGDAMVLPTYLLSLDYSLWLEVQSAGTSAPASVTVSFYPTSDASGSATSFTVVASANSIQPYTQYSGSLPRPGGSKSAKITYASPTGIKLINLDNVALTYDKENITLYTGHLKDVKFQRNKVSFLMRDKLWNLADRVVANPVTNPDSETSVVSFNNVIPSDVTWTICTCYGGLDSTASVSNTDIDYASFLEWANVFSSNNIILSAQFDGEKCQEAISDITQMTISTAWVDGGGKLVFRRLEAASADDILLDGSRVVDMDIDISDGFLVNKQWVYGGYDVNSSYWKINVFDVASASVNSYGIRENVIKSDRVWYSDSASCLEVAQRQTFVFSDPVKKFALGTGLLPVYIDVGDTVRLVDGFYSVTSADAWRITEMQTNMDNGTIKLKVENTAIGVEGFVLAVSQVNDGKLLL